MRELASVSETEGETCSRAKDHYPSAAWGGSSPDKGSLLVCSFSWLPLIREAIFVFVLPLFYSFAFHRKSMFPPRGCHVDFNMQNIRAAARMF